MKCEICKKNPVSIMRLDGEINWLTKEGIETEKIKRPSVCWKCFEKEPKK